MSMLVTISFLCLRQFSRNWYDVLALVELISSCRREDVYRISRQVASGDRRDPVRHVTRGGASCECKYVSVSELV